MWTKSYSTTVNDLSVEEIWAVWTDINQWTTWQNDIEHARIDAPFQAGERFAFKPKGAPKVLYLQLSEVIINQRFTDMTQFPLATLFGTHELIVKNEGIEIKTTLYIKGPLAWLWRKIVAENIVKDLPKQTEALIKRVREIQSSS